MSVQAFSHGLDKLIGDVHSTKGRILVHIPQQVVPWASWAGISRASSRKGGESMQQAPLGDRYAQNKDTYVQFF